MSVRRPSATGPAGAEAREGGKGGPEVSQRRRILVVDDEADVRSMLELLLSRHGYEVEAVASGMEAMIAVQARRPDLVLLDVMMRDMDGWEVLKLLQLEESTREIPVVIVSARTETRDKIRGLQEGAVDYLTKPFQIHEVLERIALVLGASSTEPASR